MRILATSREPLAITGEALWPVGPLPVPPASTGIEQALDFAAIRLFTDRAAAVSPGFAVTADDLGPVGEICRRLDGLSRLPSSWPAPASAPCLQERWRPGSATGSGY